VEHIRKLDPAVQPRDAIDLAIERSTIVADFGLEDSTAERYYAPHLHEAEVQLAQRIAAMVVGGGTPLLQSFGRMDERTLHAHIQTVAKSASAQLAKGLDEGQVKALANVVSGRSRLHTLTAGPGCGKTALMEVLVKLLPGKSIRFCGPTGKSAKVLANRVARLGCEVSTIHSMLQGGDRLSFNINAENPLTEDVLVLDEGSMPDVELFCAVLTAVNAGMHVFVLGDVGQLPSIQPGQVLADLLKIPEIDHNRLTKTHRNGGGILEVVEEVRAGDITPRDRESVKFSKGLGEADEDFPKVMGAYLDAVRTRGIENVILMLSRRQGEVEAPGWNTTYANAVLRDVCNPNAPKIPGTTLNVGDRIIIRENLELEQGDDGRGGQRKVRVVNGDTGRIASFEKDMSNQRSGGVKSLRLMLDDGRAVDFPGALAGTLGLSYALTVHAAQGSEYEEVIFVATGGSPTFINRTMLLTALSRARAKLNVFGEHGVLRRIAQTALPPRNSALVERVRHLIDRDEDRDRQDDAQHQVPAG
jgi:exodeoxyribonuclease V alpha subunit